MSTLAIIGIVLLIIGVVFCVVEGFVPGFGIFGIGGISSFVVGMILFIIDGASGLTIFLLVAGLIVLVMFCVLLIVDSSKFGILKKMALSETQTALPVDFANEKRNPFQTLVGKDGVTTKECKPTGKAMIRGSEQEVISVDFLLDEGTKIRVVKVQGNKIYVKKI